MKRVENCVTEDCIPTPSSCFTWNGGDVPYLGICDGDSLNDLVVDTIKELKRITGKDLSTFDITSLLEICKKEAPEEVTIISILSLLRDNQLCLKDFMDALDTQLALLLNNQSVKVNLKCYTNYNNLGLSLTREQVDQLVIDILCKHNNSLDSASSSIIRMEEEINEKRRNVSINETLSSTCVNALSLPLSEQVQNTSKELCDYKTVLGTPSTIGDALANTPVDLNAEFGSIVGWNPAPVKWSEYYSNTLLEVENLRQRVITIETVCCAVTCDDIVIAFSAIFNEDNTGILLKFTKGSGLIIPKGFEDCGSTGTITDSIGNAQDFDVAISLNGKVEIPLTGIIETGNVTIDIEAKICNTSRGIECHKCISQVVKRNPCQFCTLTASGNVTITYKVCTETA